MNFKIFENEFALNEKTWSHLASLLNSEDDIGVVLRAHLLTEKMLEEKNLFAKKKLSVGTSKFLL